jgi:DHA3 family macrolide efflux protein-like MFS transporter
MDTVSQPSISENWKRPFFTIWIGQVFSILGSSLVQFAITFYLAITTGSAAILTTAALVGMLPGVFLGPFAGALVDRWNRRWVMIVADGAIALVTFGLVLLFWSGLIQIWHIYVALFFRSLGGAFHYPAMAASTSLMVPERNLARIQGLNQALQGGIGIIAPMVGAFLVTAIPIQWILAIDIGTAILAIIPLLFTAIPQPVRALVAGGITPRMVLQDVREGFKFVVTWPGLLAILLMAVFLNFCFAPAGTLLPLLVTKHFGGDAYALGVVDSVFGIGIIGGGVLLGVWGGFKRKILTSMIGLIFMGAGAILTGLAPANAFFMAVLGFGLVGLTNPMVNGPLMAIIQSRVPPEMQGRVFTMVSSFAGGMMPLSMIVAAPVSELLGIQSWFLIAGSICIIMALVGLMMKPIMNIENDRPPIEKQSAPVLVGKTHIPN